MHHISPMINVIKRNGKLEEVSFNKVLKRVQEQSIDMFTKEKLVVDTIEVAKYVINNIVDNIHTTKLDEITSNYCSSLIINNPDYDKLAVNIEVSNISKSNNLSFIEILQIMNKDGNLHPTMIYYLENEPNVLIKLSANIDYMNDYLFDYFGIKSLSKNYLYKTYDANENKTARVVEKPQDMFMRVAIGVSFKPRTTLINNDKNIFEIDEENAITTYQYFSKLQFIHATPTLFNAGFRNNQCSSCL